VCTRLLQSARPDCRFTPLHTDDGVPIRKYMVTCDSLGRKTLAFQMGSLRPRAQHTFSLHVRRAVSTFLVEQLVFITMPPTVFLVVVVAVVVWVRNCREQVRMPAPSQSPSKQHAMCNKTVFQNATPARLCTTCSRGPFSICIRCGQWMRVAAVVVQ